jgi:hypothetical protein
MGMELKRRFSVISAASVLGLGVVAGPALAWDYCPPPPPPQKQHCNAGRGNGSEGCDPGNSSTSANGTTGQNRGGDECGPVSGGTAACPNKP